MTMRNNRFRTNSLGDLQHRRDNRGIGESDLAREEFYESNLLCDATTLTSRGRHSDSDSISTTWGIDEETGSMNATLAESFRQAFCQPPVGVISNIISNPRNRAEENRYIKPYRYTPSKFNFNKMENDSGDSMYLGIELEIDNGGESEDTAKFIQEYLGEDNCYIMHDGSLKDGLEITTHPSTLNYHKSLPYRSLFRELIEKGYKSHDTSTCGYHIHANRNFFGDNPTSQDLCITKILYLMEKYWEDVVIISRRDSNGYAKRLHMDEKKSMFDLLAKAKGETGGYGWSNPKYNMVNLQHSDTIEFRIFKGTLKYETFIATMEFVSNLCNICKIVNLESIQNITFDDILYFEKHRDVNYKKLYLIEYYNGRKGRV